jgi:hypothetical protein
MPPLGVVTLRVPADHAEELTKNKLANRIRMRFIPPIYLYIV